jgi:hypothetical protein
MKTVKPYIDKPFLATEVDRLVEPKKKYFDESSMTKALLLGPTQTSKGNLDEHPSMYSTVIERHATSVVHPVLQPVNYGVHPEDAKAFAVKHNEIENEASKLTDGAYSIPVKIQGEPINDPTMSGYETPNFIHKGEKELPVGAHTKASVQAVNPEAHMQNSIQQDIQNFVAQFDNAHDKAERTKVRTF